MNPARRRRATTSAVAVAGVLLVGLNLRAGIAGIPPVLDDLGLDSTGQAVLVTVPVLCFGLGALAGPRLRAWVGEERAIFGLLAVLLGGLLLRAAWPSSALFPGTVLACMGIAGINVLASSLVKRRFRDRVGAVTAAYTTVLAVGAGLAAGVTAPVLDATGSVGTALAVPALGAAVALLAWTPLLVDGGPRDRSPVRRRRGAGALWRQPLAWQVTGFMGLQSVAYYGPLSWLPAIYRDHGFDATSAGALLTVMTLVSMVGSTVAPVVAARMRDQRAAIVGATGILAAGALGVLLAPTGAPVLWALLLGVGQGASFSLALLLIVLRAADGDAAAALSSMAQSGGYFLAAVGPLAMGLLHGASGGWTAPLALLLALIAVQLAAGLAAGRDRLVASG